MSKKINEKNGAELKSAKKGAEIAGKTFYSVSDKPSGFWDFKSKPVFLGRLKGVEQLNNKDIFVFEQDGTGISFFINAGAGITTALDSEILIGNDEVKLLKDSHFLLRIEFLGKVKLKNGNNFNNFYVQYSEE